MTSLEEIDFSKIDAAIGMAVYTGRLSLAELLALTV